jgi:hypothetical protein
MFSRVASKASLRVKFGKATQGPDGEDVPVACVTDGTGLVEDPRDVLLEGHRNEHKGPSRQLKGLTLDDGPGCRVASRVSMLGES